MFSTSPVLLRPSVPKLPVPDDKFTLAEAVPMVTALDLVGTPALQFPEVFQLLSPAVPVHESAVRGGGASGSAVCADFRLATGCWLGSECCDSLRFDPADSAEAKPTTLKRTARRHRTLIHGVRRRDAGRMGDSSKKICVLGKLVRGTMYTAKRPINGRRTWSLHHPPSNVLTKFSRILKRG